MPTISDRFGLAVPSTGDPFDTADIAANWEQIDANAARFLRNTAANRPAATTENRGTLFEATDEANTLYWSTGTGWKVLDSTPIGVVTPYAGASTPPEGWLLCDGQAVSRSFYSRLYQVLGNSYGAGDGSTTFNLPDLRGRFPIGVGTLGTNSYSRGETGGAASVTLTTADIPAHTHGSGGSHSHTASAESASHSHSGSSSSHNHGHATSVSSSSHSHTASSSSEGHSHTSGTLATGSDSHSHSSGSLSTSTTGSHVHRILYRNIEVAFPSGNQFRLRTDGVGEALDSDSAGSHSHNVSGSTASTSHSHSISGSTSSNSHSHTISVGSTSHSHTVTVESNSHSHTITVGSNSHSHTVSVGSAGSHTHTSVGGGGAHENRPPFVALNFIIRAG